MNKRPGKFLILLSCISLFLVLGLVGTASHAESGKFSTMSDFIGKKISMLNGTSFDAYMEENEILQGNVEILYQNSDVDSITSLKNKKCDAIAMDSPVAEMAVALNEELTIFPEVIKDDKFGFGFKKKSPLIEPFNAAMKKLMDEGISEEMKVKWMGTDESKKVLIEQDWEGKNGTLRYWVNTGTPPMSYLGPDGTPIGYAVDLVLHIAREMDYKVEITECAFDGLIPALQGGKADLAGRSMSITPERLEKIDFSDPFYIGGAMLIIRKEDLDPSLLNAGSTAGGASDTASQDDTANGQAGEDQTVADQVAADQAADGKVAQEGGIVNSFKRTFIQEDRWKVFAKGLLTTIIISVASVVLGLILGFALFMLCRRTGKGVYKAVNAVSGVIVGIPAVVLLMVFFYVVFAKSTLNGTAVSIIAFTLIFGISVFRMLETGAGAVDPGQTEGAYALGFSDNETFFRVILPQAVMHILPIFKGELTTLVKATAVVGYIAVQDLTRAGDMVRNRTFEAFFALISVACIYYVLGKLLGLLIDRIQINFDPASRTKEQILKGVKEHV